MPRARLEDIALVRLVGFQHIGAGAGRIGLQPFVAHVAVDLIGHHGLDIDDVGRTRGQAVVDEGRRIGLVGDQRDGITVEGDLFIDIFRRETELGQDEGGGLVHLDHPAQRQRRILGRQRVARREGDPLLDLEGICHAVIGHRPAFGQTRNHLPGVGRVQLDQRVIEVVVQVDARKLERLMRVDRNDVVDGISHNQRISRGRSEKCCRCGTGQQDGKQARSGAEGHGSLPEL